MNVADIAGDPHYRERGTIVTVEDPDFGPLPMVAPLPHMSRTPGRIRSLGPRLGEHTHAVLQRFLDLDHDALADLENEKVVASDEPCSGL